MEEVINKKFDSLQELLEEIPNIVKEVHRIRTNSDEERKEKIKDKQLFEEVNKLFLQMSDIGQQACIETLLECKFQMYNEKGAESNVNS